MEIFDSYVGPPITPGGNCQLNPDCMRHVGHAGTCQNIRGEGIASTAWFEDPAFDRRLAAHKSDGKSQVGDMDPLFILEMGDVMTQGLTKYPNDSDGKPNWWKGGDYRDFCASIVHHAMKLSAGEDFDICGPECEPGCTKHSGLPHAAHIAIDAMFVRSWQRRGVGQDSRLNGGQS